MDEKIYDILEFDKILEYLAQLPVSPLGERKIRQLRPLTNPELIQYDLSLVSELREILDFDDPFPISGLLDISESLAQLKIEGRFLNAEELSRIAQTLEVARKIEAYFSDRKEKYPHLARIVRQIRSYFELEKEINRCIDRATFLLYDKASPNLNRIRREISAQEENIRRRLETMVSQLSAKGYLQESIITMRNNRLVLMVKDEHKGKIRGLVHDQSATGATVFIEPLETLEMNNRIRALRVEEEREIERILRSLSELVRSELAEISDTLEALAQLDFIYAKAQLSRTMKAGQPAINSNNRLEIINGRHPLLVLRYEGEREVVPLNLLMDEDFRTLVISGPNAGGKTVALKTVGLLCLMTACGMHIPADSGSDIPVFHQIFAVIGDQQSLENDLSTFSSHVSALKKVVDEADSKSLVLIDEIGAGTDPEEGAALAIAVLETLTKRKCLTLTSTHQGALKVFAHDTPGVENGSMEFDRDSLTPTYRFRVGIPGSSYAYEIANRLGLNPDVLKRASELVGKHKSRLESLLSDLEDRIQKYHRLASELSIKESQLEALKKLYETRAVELKKNEKKLKREAAEKAEQLLREANVTVERLIQKIKEEQASRKAIREAKEALSQQKSKIKREIETADQQYEEKQQHNKPLEKVKPGEEVYWEPYNTSGIVLSEPDASARVLIQAGEIKIKAPLKELYPVKKTQKGRKKPARVKINANIEPIQSTEIDIRGMTVDEGIEVIDKFLDEAVVSGIEQVYIIHGKGTGRLRQGIYRYLDRHPHVKGYHYPEWSLGDTGMTVVSLKI